MLRRRAVRARRARGVRPAGDGIVVLLTDIPDSGQYDAVREAAQICPAALIHVTDN